MNDPEEMSNFQLLLHANAATLFIAILLRQLALEFVIWLIDKITVEA